MAKIEKIYKIYKGDIISIPVDRETKKLIFVKAHEALGYGTQFYKEHVCVTPKEATQEELNKSLSAVGMFSDKLRKAESRLIQAKSLWMKYSANG